MSKWVLPGMVRYAGGDAVASISQTALLLLSARQRIGQVRLMNELKRTGANLHEPDRH
jgi:hypothetical protein